FLDTVSFCGLQQFNLIVNKFDQILDLVLSNDDVSVTLCTDPLVPEDPYHPALYINVSFVELEPLVPCKRTMYCYNRADFTKIHNEINSIDWQNTLGVGSVDDAVGKFYDIVYELQNKHIPQRVSKVNKYPPWYNQAIIKVLNEKMKFHRKFKKYGNVSDKQTFELLRERVKRLERVSFNDYIAHIESSLPANPRVFWSFIKSKRKGFSFPSCMKHLNYSSSSGPEISNLFSEYFHSTFLRSDFGPVQVDENTNDSIPTPLADIASIEISVDNICKLLGTLDLKKSAGPDKLPAVFLFSCSKALAVPLAILFQRSLCEGVMPLLWKSAFISPIHKKGLKDIVSNYRPISKLCLIAKIFERIVYDQIYSSLKLTFNPNQHGFLKKKSTVSNLLVFNEFISEQMDNNNQVDAVYTDYSKAFDRIDHVMLLKKLLSVGIRGDLFRWLKSYISNRTQSVVLNGYMSAWKNIPSGVPQGSLLGPLLFIIFINDIDICFNHSEFLLFADDMKVFRVVNSPKDSDLLQDDLNRLATYCRLNSLDINVSKCFSISFGRKRNMYQSTYSLSDQSISICNEIKDLGVIMDSKLLFDKHVDAIVKKAYKLLGFVMRSCKNFKLMKSIKIIYCTLVRSNLEYASQVWNPRYGVYISKIESIQKKFIRFLCYKFKIPRRSYEFHCNQFHLLPLQIRREAADLIFLTRLAQNSIDCPDLLNKINLLVPSRPLRLKSLVHVPLVHTNYRQNSFLLRASRSFNTLSNDCRDIDMFCSSARSISYNLTNKFSSTIYD
ncbi:unnamed protein product, partial [Plutella xylostella]